MKLIVRRRPSLLFLLSFLITLCALPLLPFQSKVKSAHSTATAVIQPMRRDNGKIAFETQRTLPSMVYTTESDGSRAAALSELGTARYPAWSFDGARIAATDANELKIANADGSNPRKITFEPSTRIAAPTWSPDGTRLAFSIFDSGGPPTGIYLINADGSGRRQISDQATARTLRWSPDGTRLLFAVDGRIKTCLIDGSQLREITQPPTTITDTDPAWSPDGTQIVFARAIRTLGGFEPPALHIMNADGSNLRRLTDIGQPEIFPVFAPDGSKIAFIRSGNLYVMNPDGSGVAQLTDSQGRDGTSGIDWQPLTAATPRTVFIAGRIKNESGRNGLIEITLSGTRSAKLTQVANGDFAFGNLPPGGNYTITVAGQGFRFEPPSRSLTDLRADAEVDFTATALLFRISGQVRDNAGIGIAGINITLGSEFPPQRFTQTDADGRYAFDYLFGSGRYQLYIASEPGPDAYDPSRVTFPNGLDNDKVINFTGPRLRYGLSGRVLDADGNGLSGVTVTTSGGGNNCMAMTDASGQFSFADLPGGFSYTVMVAKAGVTINPPTQTLLLNFARAVTFHAGARPVTAVAATDYRVASIASGGIVALFGEGLAETTRAGGLAQEIDGVTVHLTVEANNERACPLFFISPGQINFLLPVPFGPPSSALFGEGIVTVKRNGRVIAASAIHIERIAPSLFAADATGRGLAAAVALRVRADGTQVYEEIARYDAAQGRIVAVPLEVGHAGEQVFLVLYGSGIQLRSALEAVALKVGGAYAQITYAGPQPAFFGLEQVNALLPASLKGRGEIELNLTVEGRAANPLKINIK